MEAEIPAHTPLGCDGCAFKVRILGQGEVCLCEDPGMQAPLPWLNCLDLKEKASGASSLGLWLPLVSRERNYPHCLRLHNETKQGNIPSVG